MYNEFHRFSFRTDKFKKKKKKETSSRPPYWSWQELLFDSYFNSFKDNMHI